MRLPDDDRGRPGERAASSVNSGDVTRIPLRVDAFLHDALLDVLMTGERYWWLKRAETFERAKPVPGGDYTGQASRQELSAQWQRLDEMARACRARAELCSRQAAEHDVATVLSEAS